MPGKTIGVAVPDSDLLELTISEITVLIEGEKNWIWCREGVCPYLERAYLKLVFIFLYWC